MSEIFISYARSTAHQAQAVAEALRGLGYDVWRDDELPAHRSYTEVIEERLQDLNLSERVVVRLKGQQDILRRSIFRVSYIQKMEFVPSVHVLVQTLVLASLFVLLFLKTAGAWESMLILIFVGYMFIYSLMLIGHLDQPFREGEGTVDDVSLFLLRDFLAKIAAEDAPAP